MATETWGQLKSLEGSKLEILDAEFTREVSKIIGGQDLTACFQCAKCSGGCPVSDKVNVQVHQLMRMLLFGLEEVLKTDMVWLCTTCYQCQQRCPQGINITDIIFGLKNMAFRKGINPPGYVASRKALYDSGKLYEPTDWERDDLGLGPVPPLDVAETRKVLDKTGLMKLREGE
ncbi:MAG: heterodisulfide reductase [Candidatus Thorarchaeota archaeon]|nr:MAG: heterodisulfide reductase [Candidatus Thorarchaeota archaeon]